MRCSLRTWRLLCGIIDHWTDTLAPPDRTRRRKGQEPRPCCSRAPGGFEATGADACGTDHETLTASTDENAGDREGVGVHQWVRSHSARSVMLSPPTRTVDGKSSCDWINTIDHRRSCW